MTKHLLLITLLSYCCCTSARAQDIIVKKSGDTILARMVTVNTPDINYRKYNKPHGLVYTLPKWKVALIRYENGGVDSLDNKVRTTPLEIVVGDPYKAGVKDAQKYYKDYKSSGSATFIVGLLSPVAGLAPAIACSSTPPQEWNLGYPNPDFMQNPEYARGYKNQAKLTKQGRVWTNWGIALGINVLFAFALLMKH